MGVKCLLWRRDGSGLVLGSEDKGLLLASIDKGQVTETHRLEVRSREDTAERQKGREKEREKERDLQAGRCMAHRIRL
jgi:hypothetical protein